jgi:glucose/arabinose dehydrogenase
MRSAFWSLTEEIVMQLHRIFFAAFIPALIASESKSQIDIEVAFPRLTFNRPVDLQHPGDGTDRIFVVEQAGIIKVFENTASVTSAQVFLDIRDRVNDSGNEEGLLGLAFHPNYENNGFFYVNYTAINPRRTVIARYTVSTNDPNQADRNSELVLLEFSQPFSNHNGGQLAFGPDGYLYIASGDGGSGGDPQGNGQSLRTVLGKILRIDVDNPSGNLNYGIPSDNPFAGNTSGFREEIYAYGLRNPWRFSFDPVTGWIWAGDVGQNRREEVDIIEKGGNYGWNLLEGNLCFPSGIPCTIPGLVNPILDYGRSLGASITGGYVYRSTLVPQLTGAYIYADFVSGRVWALRYDGVNPPINTELQDTPLNISSFGIDQNNELYICAFDGKIYRFKSTVTTVDEGETLPTTNKLAQNYPNPFSGGARSTARNERNSSTTIQYTLNQSAAVEMSIYNLRGQLIRTLVNHTQSAGTHTVAWDGRDNHGAIQPSGTYFYRLRVGDDFVETKKLMIAK